MCNTLVIATQNGKIQIVQLMFIVLPEREELFALNNLILLKCPENL